jgi:hypothetical protein
MSMKPEGVYSPSDDELDELVEATGDEGTAPDPAPEPARPAPDAESASVTPEDDETDNAAAGEHDEDDELERQPAPADGEPLPDADPAAPPAAIPPGAKPFTYSASKGQHTLPGALELADGSIVIAKDAQPEFRRFVASSHELRAHFTQFQRDTQRKLQQAETARVARAEEAEAVYGLFTELKKMSPEERWEFFQKFDEEAPKLELAIEKKKIAADRKALEEERAGPQPTPEEQQEQVQQLLTSELNATFRSLAEQADAKLFTRDELIALYQKWAKRPQRLARTLSADEGEFKKGQTIFDDSEVWEDFGLIANVKRRAGAAPAPVGAAARNAALNADQSKRANPIPPVVTPRRPAAGQARNSDGTFKGNEGRKKFKQDFMRGDLDDED